MNEIKSINIADFRLTLRNYILNQPFPMELKRMVLKEIYDEVNLNANKEMLLQAQEREALESEQSIQ